MLLDGFVRRDEPGRVIGAEEIPCVEAREVLKGAEKLIAADYGEQCVSIESKTGVQLSLGGASETHLLSQQSAGSELH